jgi:hypothetical protein
MVMPNFLIVGAMKAGTTWLAHMLRDHPDVYVGDQEYRFFSDDALYANGPAWYEGQFSEAGAAKAVGEKTADYMLRPEVLARIDNTLPGVRLIAVVREPVARAVSQINHHIRYGELAPPRNGTSFSEDEFERLAKEFSVLDRGLYRPQIESLYDRFGRARVRVIVNETDIRDQPRQTLREVCEFLGVDADAPFPHVDKRVHAHRSTKLGLAISGRLPSLRRIIPRAERFLPGPTVLPYTPTPDEAHWLHSFYDQENAGLFRLLDRPMPDSWRADRARVS